jgi:O-acetyl-ADP-ribose deacetylase
MSMHTKLLVIQGDITQLRVDVIVRTGGVISDAAPDDLHIPHVIHTEGPVWTDGTQQEAALLGKTYHDALVTAVSNHAKTIAFPNISTGRSGYPKKKAALVALTTVRNFLKEWPGTFTEIIFACWDTENYHLYKDMLGSENLVVQ